MADQYIPKAESLAWRVCVYFRRLPEEELTAKDISLKWDTDSHNVAGQLQSAVDHGLLVREYSTFKAGPNIGWIDLTPLAVKVAEKPMPGRDRMAYPEIDIEALQPTPIDSRPPNITERWIAKMQAMPEGTFVIAPAEHAHPLRSAATEVNKAAASRVRVLRHSAGQLRVEKHAAKGVQA